MPRPDSYRDRGLHGLRIAFLLKIHIRSRLSC
jgi:hypothetical protein